MTFRLRPEAEADLEAIALHIAKDNPAAALRWYDEMYESCRSLGVMPGMGVSRPDVRPDLRTFSVVNYLILYREIDNGAEVVRVVHGARQWQELL